jgi:heat-inducible transcriptional repressor
MKDGSGAIGTPRSNEIEVDLDPRKSAILKAVVDEHINTGQPVGSQHLSEAAGLTVSAATIRNEMSALERDGYLMHPHTSAGRIPTDRGYRFFVDNVGANVTVAEPVAVQVKDFFDQAKGEIERMLDHTSRLLSDLTHYTAVVVAPELDLAMIRSVQVVTLGPGPVRDGQSTDAALVVIVLSNGSVDKHHIELPSGITSDQINVVTSTLTRLLLGSSVATIPSSVFPSSDNVVDATCDKALKTIRAEHGSHDAPLFVGGTANMATAFDAIQTVRSVLSLLEQQYLVVDLLRETVRAGSNVSIGAEHGSGALYEPLSSCSIVAAPYLIDGRVVGSVGVLGPTRMNYPQVMAAVAAVSERLSERLTEGP